MVLPNTLRIHLWGAVRTLLPQSDFKGGSYLRVSWEILESNRFQSAWIPAFTTKTAVSFPTAVFEKFDEISRLHRLLTQLRRQERVKARAFRGHRFW